ncbi:hypothetical protein GGI11_005658 [Coemansia sp. RSA 2049]|nr:hypothetical protein GGI11_005658 [Coemansia sp. RSA 2049]KAJ2511313.1 hypothetical protein H4217_007445 [Coemansia sp. RSA 1939]KAJ2606243.1 hypothetical protein EV177_005954 [Coemansia sp. RSA 1804]
MHLDPTAAQRMVAWPDAPEMGQSPIRLCVPSWTYEDRYNGQPIVRHLLLGPYHLVRNSEYLASHGVEHVLCIRDPSEQRFLRELEIPGIRFTLMDVPADVSKVSIIPHFVQATRTLAELVEQQGRTVLVCCSDGVDKSSAFVAAYLMHTYALKAADAITFVQNSRYCATPSANGYRIKLLEYEPICAAQRGANAGAQKNLRKRINNDAQDDTGEVDGGAASAHRPIAPLPSSKRAR